MTQSLIIHTNLKTSAKYYFFNGKRISYLTAKDIMSANDKSVIIGYRDSNF